MTENIFPIAVISKKITTEFSFELKILAKDEDTLNEVYKTLKESFE